MNFFIKDFSEVGIRAAHAKKLEQRTLMRLKGIHLQETAHPPFLIAW